MPFFLYMYRNKYQLSFYPYDRYSYTPQIMNRGCPILKIHPIWLIIAWNVKLTTKMKIQWKMPTHGWIMAMQSMLGREVVVSPSSIILILRFSYLIQPISLRAIQNYTTYNTKRLINAFIMHLQMIKYNAFNRMNA